MTTLLLDPIDTDRLYVTMAAAYSGSGVGLFRSTDAGASWNLLVNSIGNRIHSADISPAEPSVVYVHRYNDGLYRSDDRGDTWTLLSELPGHDEGDICPFAHPADPQIVYAAVSFTSSSDGVYRSEDRGRNWTARNSGISDTKVTALAFDASSPLVMYAGTASGNVYHSADGGASWSHIGKPDNYISNIAVNPFGDHEPWVACYEEGNYGYLWRYNGSGWGFVDTGMGMPLVCCVAFNPMLDDMVLIGLGGEVSGTLVSYDGGASWDTYGPVTNECSATTVALDPLSGETVYLGCSGLGLFKTADAGQTWVEINQGLAGIYPQGLAASPLDIAEAFATVHGTGVFRTTNSGDDWAKLPTGNKLPSAPLVDPFLPERVYVGAGSGISISDDGGSTWRGVTPALPEAYAVGCGTTVIKLIATGEPGHLLLGVAFFENGESSSINVGGGVYRSVDYGETWSFTDMGSLVSPVGALAADPNDPLVVYAGTHTVCEATESGIWKSTDGGVVWVHAGFDGCAVAGIAFDTVVSGRVYACVGSKFHVSEDGAESWQLLSRIGDYGIDNLIVAPTTPQTIYRYGWRGLLFSLDDGLTWSRVEGGLGTSMIGSMDVAVDGQDVVVYVGTAGGGASGQ